MLASESILNNIYDTRKSTIFDNLENTLLLIKSLNVHQWNNVTKIADQCMTDIYLKLFQSKQNFTRGPFQFRLITCFASLPFLNKHYVVYCNTFRRFNGISLDASVKFKGL